jgi:dihydrofolate reductase
MRKLIAFEQVSLDGYFTDAKGDMSWAHKQDKEWNEFTSSNASGEAALLFGRVTYQQMESFWPTEAAAKMLPAVADAMNRMQKFVFSRTLEKVGWQNTTLLKGDPVVETRKLKKEAGPDLVIMGSGTIVSPLAQAGLVDLFQLAVNPIVLGKGRTLFETVEGRLDLKLLKSRAFGNGNVVLEYGPAA